MPSGKSNDDLKLIVADVRPEIAKIIAFACRKYNHSATPDEVEEFTEQIIFLLLEDNCRRLKTYDSTKAQFSTWLRPVIYHEVLHHYQKLRPTQPIEDLVESQFSAAATQEEELLAKERLNLLLEAICQLTPHDQRIAQIKITGATDHEIAQNLNIKVRSLQQEWSRIVKRLKAIINKKMGGGGKHCATLN